MLIFRIYKLITIIIRPFLFLFFIYRLLKNKEEFGKYSERRGLSLKVKPEGKIIWIHAASVGETLSTLPLIKKLKELSPKINIIITTSTKTSKEIIIKKNMDRVFHQYVPWDNKNFCINFLSQWKPDIAVFLESEIWPNLLYETKRKKIPISLINARITNKTYSRWLKFPKTISYLLSFFSLIVAQDNLSKNKLHSLGAKNIFVYGNLKNDSEKLSYNAESFKKYNNYFEQKDIIVAASTHRGEEKNIVNVFKSLIKELPDLFLVMAPRHPERRNEIASLLKKQGFSEKEYLLRSGDNSLNENIKIFILDTIGELGYFYEKSKVVVLGGAFGEFGGHNPLEPARFNNAIFSGPNYFNFKDEYDQLLNIGGVKIISDTSDLHIIKEKKEIKEMAKNSKIYSDNIGGIAEKISVKLIGLLNEI
tara:strand:+ start:29409 stop:30671 length:1263 start_codon:yes stop_codon:yes gene_type:complete